MFISLGFVSLYPGYAGFNEHGQRIITENWLAALGLALAVFFNWVCGLRQIAQALSRAKQNGFWAIVARMLGFGDIRGGAASAALTVIAYVTVSGMAYQWLGLAAG